MLLRKRAWDMMREDYPTVLETASLAEAIRVLRQAMKAQPDTLALVVKRKNGSFRGIISAIGILKAIEGCVLNDEELKLSREADWDQAFTRASTICCQTELDGHIEENVPLLKPNDPLLVVMETFLASMRSWAVVEEGGMVIGLVFISDLYRELTRDMVKAF